MFFSTLDATFLTEIKEIMPSSKAIARDKLWPFIDQAERKYIYPLLEKDLYDDLQTFCNQKEEWSGGSGEDETHTAELLKLIRIAELNLAYLLGFNQLNVVNSASGFQRTGESEAFKGLYKYQEENLKKDFETAGYNGLDDMLRYIEDYIEYFPEWEDSVNCTLRKTAIIKDAVTFNAICFINSSRLTFLRLQIYMQEVLDFDIIPLMGTEWASLQSELIKDFPAAKYSALLPVIQKPLAFLCCAKLIEKTGTLTDRGFFFEGKNSIYPDDTTKKMAEGDAALVMANSYRSTGEKYLQALAKYLVDNSFTGTGSAEGTTFHRDNTDKKTFVAL